MTQTDDGLFGPTDRHDLKKGVTFSTGTPLQGGLSISAHDRVHHPSLLRAFETYWHDLRRATQLPLRSEIEPARIDAALPHAFIVEEVAPGLARLRVAGQRLHTLLGMEARGMPLSTFFTNEARATVRHYLNEVFARPAILDLPVLSPRSLGRSRLEGRLLVLPLAHERDGPRRAMGALMVDGAVGSGPRRFEVPDDGTIRLEDLNGPARRRLGLVTGSDRVAAQPVVGQGPDAKAPGLHLVVSND